MNYQQSWPTYNALGRPPYQNGQLRVRPVSSLEEAKASPIDFDGSVFYFHDVANKKIYTKQFDLNGMMQVDTYVYQEPAVPAPPLTQTEAANFVTKDEFKQTINALIEKLNTGGKTDDEQSASNVTEFKF